MIGLGSLRRSLLFFTSTKLPMCAPVGQRGARTQPRERTDDAVRLPLVASLQHAVGMHHRVGAKAHVAQHAVRADAHAVTQLHLSLEHHVHVDEHIATHGQLAALVKARWINQRHAGTQQRVGALFAQRRLELRQLQLVIHAQHFRLGAGNHAAHAHARLHRHGDDIGEVELALRIVGAQLAQPRAQRPRGRHQHAGVALAAGAAARASHPSVRRWTSRDRARPHHATIAGGIRQLHGQQRELPVRGQCHQLAQRFARAAAARRRTAPAPGDRPEFPAWPAARRDRCPAALACSAHWIDRIARAPWQRAPYSPPCP